jgi:hypothetical protein
MKMRVRSNFSCRKERPIVRLTVFTIRLGLLLSALVSSGQVVNSSPSSSVPANATPITTVSLPATTLGQAIEQIVPSQSVGAVSQSANPSAIAATAPAPTVTLSASRTALWSPETTKLTWTSANATACRGTGKDFSPSAMSGSLVLAPVATTTYRLSCTGAGGSASQSVTVDISAPPVLATGITVATTGTTYIYSTPSKSTSPIGGEALGNEGAVVGGPVSANGLTWWQVVFDDDLTGWTYQSGPTYAGLETASLTAPTLTFGANPPSIARGSSSTLSWSSTKATGCSGTGFSPRGVSGSVSVSPTASTTYSITCTGLGGSTTRSAAVVVNPFPRMSWSQSLPVTFGDPAIVPFGGTETRGLLFMDGSLYAGIGDWEDPRLKNPKTPGAQVLRLDSPTSDWVEDQDFNQVAPSSGEKDYQAIATLGMAHFNHDSGNNKITPVDVLMAGFWNLGTGGVSVAQKTVTAGSVGAQGTWTTNLLVRSAPGTSGEVRSFASYTDSVTHEEMAFAGSDSPNGTFSGIFSGGFDSASNAIVWGSSPEAGTVGVTKGGDRVMSMAVCGGKLYATMYDAVLVRADGASPSWQIFYQYSGPALPSTTSGFRGLTCVPNLYGSGSMLIVSLQSDSNDIYDLPLDGSTPIVELYASNFLSSQLETWVAYGIAGYSNMIVYPESGTKSCPDLLIGVGVLVTTNYADDYQGLYPTTSFLIRHCNGVYDFQTIVDPSITPSPPLISTRVMAVSQFSGDPAGTIYVGGYDAHFESSHNTDWIYKGVPQTPE